MAPVSRTAPPTMTLTPNSHHAKPDRCGPPAEEPPTAGERLPPAFSTVAVDGPTGELSIGVSTVGVTAADVPCAGAAAGVDGAEVAGAGIVGTGAGGSGVGSSGCTSGAAGVTGVWLVVRALAIVTLREGDHAEAFPLKSVAWTLTAYVPGFAQAWPA